MASLVIGSLMAWIEKVSRWRRQRGKEEPWGWLMFPKKSSGLLSLTLLRYDTRWGLKRSIGFNDIKITEQAWLKVHQWGVGRGTQQGVRWGMSRRWWNCVRAAHKSGLDLCLSSWMVPWAGRWCVTTANHSTLPCLGFLHQCHGLSPELMRDGRALEIKARGIL